MISDELNKAIDQIKDQGKIRLPYTPFDRHIERVV